MAVTAEEAQYQRELKSSLSTARGLPNAPAPAETEYNIDGIEDIESGDQTDEDGRRRQLDNRRFEKSQIQKGLEDTAEGVKNAVGLATGAISTPAVVAKAGMQFATDKDKRTKMIWAGIMQSLETAFWSTSETIILPIMIAPIIVFLYAFRLFRVNLLNGGRSVKFPILGIVDLEVPALDFPVGVATGVAWIFTSMLVVIILIALAILIMAAVGQICQAVSLGSFCTYLPQV